MSQSEKPGGGDVPRFSASERVTHWLVAITFVLLAASGLAFFHPAFWPLADLLGGGVWSRILHPYVGVVMFVFFLAMAMRYWADNKIQPYDREWNKRMSDVINNRDANLPEIDKYNIGQKQLFWALVVSMFALLVSGVVMWRDLVSLPVTVVRVGLVIHALAAFVLILGMIVHIYSAVFWVKGALRAMTRGTVTRAWARHHHPLWYRRVTGQK